MGPLNPASSHYNGYDLPHQEAIPSVHPEATHSEPRFSDSHHPEALPVKPKYTPGTMTATLTGLAVPVTTAHADAASFREIVADKATPTFWARFRQDAFFPFRNGGLHLAWSNSVLKYGSQMGVMSLIEEPIRSFMPSHPLLAKTTASIISGLFQAAVTIGPGSISQQLKYASLHGIKTSPLEIFRSVPKKDRRQFLFGNYGLVAARDSLYAGIFYPTTVRVDEQFSKDRENGSVLKRFGIGMFSAATAGALAVPITHPIQVALIHAKRNGIKGNIEALKDVIKKKGVMGLYAGLSGAFPRMLISAATVGGIMSLMEITYDHSWEAKLKTWHIPHDHEERSRIAEHHFERALHSHILFAATSCAEDHSTPENRTVVSWEEQEEYLHRMNSVLQ
jgi:hypothetical protein